MLAPIKRMSRQFVVMCNALNSIWAQASNNLSIRLVEWHLRLALTGPCVPSRVGSVAITLTATGIAACAVLVPSIRTAVDQFESIETVLTGLGATYGTILALVLTLSIIPIQRAGESWSASILRLYRRDKVTHVTFVSLGVLCVTSFALAVGGLPQLPVSFILAASFALLGVSLDLLRGYHAHVCLLLDPQHAVSTGLKEAKKALDRLNRVVHRDSWLRHRRPFAKRKPAVSRGLIEANALLLFIPGYPGVIIDPLNDLAEMALRAIARAEKPLAAAAIAAIAELINHYLSGRQRNLTLHQGTRGTAPTNSSDADVVTHPAYDLLREISRAAVKAENEITAIRVSQAFRSIAVHAANLAAPAFSPNTAPLSYAPVYHAFDCVKFAQSQGLDEVAFQSASILAEIPFDVPKNIAVDDLHAPLVDGLHDIAVAFYSNRRFHLAEAVTKNQLMMLSTLLIREEIHFLEVLKGVLERVALQVPLSIDNENAAGHADAFMPLKHAYDPTDMVSVGWLFGNTLRWLYQADDERAYQNTYAQTLRFLHFLSDHLREVAQNNEFGSSLLLREIDGLIKHIAIRVADFIDEPAPLGQGNHDELIRGFIRLLAFYPAAFRDKSTIHARRVEQCSDTISYIALRFLSSGRPAVLTHCVWCIESVIGSYCQTTHPPNYFTLADVFALLWGIREVAIAQDHAEIVQDLDRALGQPSSLTVEQWQQAQDAIQVRREQLLDRLREPDSLPHRDNAESLLRQLSQPPPAAE